MTEFVPMVRANPQIPEDTAIRLLARQWGIDATVARLGSRQDQNFRAGAVDGRRYVLKVTVRVLRRPGLPSTVIVPCRLSDRQL